ncbi:MAG: DNA polymerase I [Chloroflexi bacterium]|nr:MAG: DNA polymerase I [Chloroflexota bacterium]
MKDNTQRKTLVLIDGHALAYRAFHALPADMSTSQGEPTNATYGFASMLLKVLEEHKPDYIAVSFDAGYSSRKEKYAEYKAQRVEMADSLRIQMDRIRELVEAFNMPVYEVEGYEADDVLGTLAKQAEEAGVETLIVTGDTDTFQLIDPHVRVLTSRGYFSDTIVYDEEGIHKRYGLKPEQLPDYKGLKGDPSDNIPGVPGIGDKTATALLKEYGTVENVLEHLDEISNTRARNALARHRDIALLGKELAVIQRDVPVQLDLEKCRLRDYDRDRVMQLFRELQFRSLVDRLPEPEGPTQLSMFDQAGEGPTLTEANYHTVDEPADLQTLVDRLVHTESFAVDTETTSEDAMLADLVGLAFAIEPGEAWYVPVGHDADYNQWRLDLGMEPAGARPRSNLGLKETLDAVRPVLADPNITKVAHNVKYDMMVLALHGADLKGPLFDTMIAAWLLEPSRRTLNLKDIAWSRLGVEMQPITELIGKGRNQITMAQVPIEPVTAYAGADVDMTIRLARLLESELREHPELWRLFQDVEMPLVPVLADMEMAGIRIDPHVLADISRAMHQRITALEQEIYEIVGYEFNVNSPQQLADVLFEELRLPKKRRTKTGYSTAASVLQEIRDEGSDPYGICDLILEYRHLTKLKGTYVDALPALINPRTGRVHTSFNQTATVTGRLSSTNPNLQNIPIRTEVGRQIRKAFVADEGYLLVSADYSQIELRILAHISGEPRLVEAFRRDEDIHASTAATLFDVPLDQVTPEMRRLAKMANFGIIYGLSGYGLSQRTDMTRSEANAFVENYLARLPRVQAYIEETKRKAREQGYVETLLGRRRYFPELQRRRVPRNLREAAYREAINAPIQGTQADIIKLAMIQLHDALQTRRQDGHGPRMLLQVHDELLLEVPRDEIDDVVPLVRETMGSAFELDVPIKVDVKVGPNWCDMEDYQSSHAATETKNE